MYYYYNIGVILSLESCQLTIRIGINRVPVEQRVCETFIVVEDEYHVVMDCRIYDNVRDRLFTEICGIYPSNSVICQ